MKITQIQGLVPALPRRKRVAAYARVSSGKEAMLHSLSAQISYYSDYIRKHSDWEYVQVFVDEALTGTKEARPQFQEMLEACRSGKIDIIITKSISRFARNTVTVLESVRELKNLGVDVFFEEQNIHSMSAEGEVMLTILASYAQEESLSASENQKWRIRKNFQEGVPSIGKLLGYRLKNGVFEVVPEEAKIVKQIFELYLDGKGLLAIQKQLALQGCILSKRGIHVILTQEKYVGDLHLQKTFVQDNISKKRMKNDGQLPQFYVSNSHEAIINRTTFSAVQEEMSRRARKHQPISKAPLIYPYTGLIKCGKCGASYRRKHANAGSKYEKIVWICETFNSKGKSACDSQQIPENILDKKATEMGGLDIISSILVPEKHKLIFTMKDGTQQKTVWQNRSRSESWTAEIRQAVSIQNSIRKKKKEVSCET
ncbi:recombinase family protein [Scatolibacter rhodanostii]|uniref:recombinase family protein n=1 Tax=Scatolibacter rhodanostii TaxID=2014781 RepID=UPI001FA92EF1|nr:recombinase family protein [Scatolibacter rhodanostii]